MVPLLVTGAEAADASQSWRELPGQTLDPVKPLNQDMYTPADQGLD